MGRPLALAYTVAVAIIIDPRAPCSPPQEYLASLGAFHQSGLQAGQSHFGVMSKAKIYRPTKTRKILRPKRLRRGFLFPFGKGAAELHVDATVHGLVTRPCTHLG